MQDMVNSKTFRANMTDAPTGMDRRSNESDGPYINNIFGFQIFFSNFLNQQLWTNKANSSSEKKIQWMFNHQTSPGDKMRVTWPVSWRLPRGSLWTLVVSVESRHLEKKNMARCSSRQMTFWQNDTQPLKNIQSKLKKFRIQRRFMNKCKNTFLLALDDNMKMDCALHELQGFLTSNICQIIIIRPFHICALWLSNWKHWT